MDAGNGGSRLSMPLVLVVLLALATGVNLGQFPSLEASGSASIARPMDGRDLTAAADEYARTTRERFVLYLQLGEVAEGGRVLAYWDSGLDRDSLLGLSRVGEVVFDGYDPVIPEDLGRVLAARATYRGEHRRVGEYAIVPEPFDQPAEIVTVTDGTTTFLVDRALLPAGTPASG